VYSIAWTTVVPQINNPNVHSLQVGISLVGVSRVLAGGNDSSSADSLQDMLWTPPSSSSSSSSSNMGIGASEASNAAADPKKALLGMCLIILSQVSKLV
jgi:hypothetical protein